VHRREERQQQQQQQQRQSIHLEKKTELMPPKRVPLTPEERRERRRRRRLANANPPPPTVPAPPTRPSPTLPPPVAIHPDAHQKRTLPPFPDAPSFLAAPKSIRTIDVVDPTRTVRTFDSNNSSNSSNSNDSNDSNDSKNSSNWINCYRTDRIAVFWGGDFKLRLLTAQQIMDTASFIGRYFDVIERDFGLQRDSRLATQRYAVYVSHSGLDPKPNDCGEGVVGYAGEVNMTLVPDVFARIHEDTSTAIHEIGHALFRVPWLNVGWLEEGLCEALAWHYDRKYVTVYDVARSYIFKKHFTDIFDRDHAYDLAPFWIFLMRRYGGPATVGRVADGAFRGAPPAPDVWELVARALGVPSRDLIRAWVRDVLTLAFWDAGERAVLLSRMGRDTRPYDRATMTWSAVTLAPGLEPGKRLGKGGFEVVDAATAVPDSLDTLYISIGKDAATVSSDAPHAGGPPARALLKACIRY
jgi:hypothetical protein